MSINRQVIMKMLEQVPDEDLIKGFSTLVGGAGAGGMDMDPNAAMIDGMSADPNEEGNQVKSWNNLKIEKGEDNRPAIADKAFLVSKADKMNHLLSKNGQQSRGMGAPQDDTSGAYDGFGNGSF